jgi:hypothetical protein
LGATRSEETAREALKGYNPDDVMRLIERQYHESQEPIAKARALAALSVSPVATGVQAEALRHRKFLLAEQGFSDGRPEMAVLSLRAIRAILPGDPNEKELVLRVLDSTENRSVIWSCFATLAKWGADDAILGQLAAPRPEGDNASVLASWRIRMKCALLACRTMDWRQNENAPLLAEKVADLIRRDEQMRMPGARCLVAIDTPPILPVVIQAYNETEESLTKTILAAAVHVLAPETKPAREWLRTHYEQLLAGSAPVLAVPDLIAVNGWIARGAVKAHDVLLLEQIWPANRTLCPADRWALFTSVLFEIQLDEDLTVSFLESLSDADLREMLRASPSAGSLLLRKLAQDGPESIPSRGNPNRKKQWQRVSSLLE